MTDEGSDILDGADDDAAGVDDENQDWDVFDHAASSAPVSLSVHALTEFVFCPRAGVLAVETIWNVEPPEEHSFLRFSLPYTLVELECSLQRNLNMLWILLGVGILTATSAIYGLATGSNVVTLGAGLVFALLAVLARYVFSAVRALTQLRAHAAARTGRTPRLDATESQPVDWWEMLADGWMSDRNEAAYRDRYCGLAGMPWRNLAKGDVAIPVFKLVHSDPQDPQLFPQHIVRMAGYCHLIKTCERRQSPCGVLLFGNSYRGLTIPNTPTASEMLDTALDKAHEVLATEAKDGSCPLPASLENCRGCPWGKPRRYRQDETDRNRLDELVPTYGKVASNKKLYHSSCGDRFQWIPPHEEAVRLGIV